MPLKPTKTDVIIIGASASGLMCAIEAGKRGRKVIVLDHANKAGKKILMSGGGRCNFTNMDVDASNFISNNPHFCKSALSRYTQWDFIALVNEYNIAYHERDLGKLFCDDSAKDILEMLLQECKNVNVRIYLNVQISAVHKAENFIIETQQGGFQASSLVIACGGLSIPKMCASPLGYQLAEQFGHKIWPTRAGLVPFTLQPEDKKRFENLSGISVESNVSSQQIDFNNENILFTHRGLSGPAILQVSSYWKPGEAIKINLLPDKHVAEILKSRQKKQPNLKLKTVLNEILPKRLVPLLFNAPVFNDPIFNSSSSGEHVIEKTLQELSQVRINEIAERCHQWQIKPNGTEGYRTAEVTLGGVDCNELSSKTMESSKVSDLYFIGEVIDVTGWLGGYNFQWAWSSGWCAGQVV